MKKTIIIALLILLAANTYAEIQKINFTNEEFAEDTYVIRFNPDFQNLVDPIQLNSHSYNYCIQEKNKKYQIRYILFSEKKGTKNNLIQFPILATTVLFNIHGTDKFENNTSMFSEEDVKNEFNADAGFTNFAFDIESDYSDDYKFIMTNFFYKKGLGIMCQTIQFNDIEFTKTQEFIEIFHSFNFY